MLTNKKTVDSVLSQFKKTITDLETIKSNNLAGIQSENDLIQAAKSRISSSEDEVTRASSAIRKFQELFSV